MGGSRRDPSFAAVHPVRIAFCAATVAFHVHVHAFKLTSTSPSPTLAERVVACASIQGVSVFFTLSAFFTTRSLLARGGTAIEAGGRRASRLLPLVAAAVGTDLLLNPSSFRDDSAKLDVGAIAAWASLLSTVLPSLFSRAFLNCNCFHLWSAAVDLHGTIAVAALVREASYRGWPLLTAFAAAVAVSVALRLLLLAADPCIGLLLPADASPGDLLAGVPSFSHLHPPAPRDEECSPHRSVAATHFFTYYCSGARLAPFFVGGGMATLHARGALPSLAAQAASAIYLASTFFFAVVGEPPSTLSELTLVGAVGDVATPVAAACLLLARFSSASRLPACEAAARLTPWAFALHNPIAARLTPGSVARSLVLTAAASFAAEEVARLPSRLRRTPRDTARTASERRSS